MQECTSPDYAPRRIAHRVGLNTAGNYGKSFTAEYPRR
ncbi:hypothetical protein SUDANB19_05587 [Streptomyces sp. enrichment culture]